MLKKNVADLIKMYQDAKEVDRDSFAEMRSNILLSAGEHFTKGSSFYWNRVRTSSELTERQKLRITKNWLHKYLRLYINAILSKNPGTTVKPQNMTELQDQKSAELNLKVWKFMKLKYKYKKLVRQLVDDYCRIGEVCIKMFFDPNGGKLQGYEATVDDDGFQVIDDMGQPVPDLNKPVFTGEMKFERVLCHQLLRDPGVKSMDESMWYCIEKLEPLKKMQAQYRGDAEKQKFLVESKDEYIVFDNQRLGYQRAEDQVSIREFYFKPCMEYPNGYYFLSTEAGILEEGELPFGIFPILWCGFDEHPTKARATGFIRVARPWQAEVNRASSQTAQHQITLADDKILYQAGSKVQQGTLLPGVRGLTYQGTAPTILPGRNGSQFYEYVDKQVSEMGSALMIDEITEDKVANLDPFTLLYRSMKEQSRFSFYNDKFGDFMVEITEKALMLAKEYLSDEDLMEAVGKDEIVNIAEFKTSKPQHYSIEIEQADETLESRLGRQLTSMQIMQYVGKQLGKDDIGRLIKNLPFGNWEDGFEELTMNETNAKNDFLALERGEMPMVSPADDSAFILRAVATRKKKRDFALLAPNVQQMYMQYEQYHMSKQAEEAQKLRAAEAAFIPTGGAMVAADMYVPNSDPDKAPKRVRLPYEAVEWLVNMLDSQGKSMEQMEQMNQAQLAQLAGMITGGGQLTEPQGSPQINPGQAMPI